MNQISNNKGSIIIYSLLIMSVILAIGFSMNTMFIRNLRNVSAAHDSVIALYAADVGVELCIYEARTETGIDNGDVVLGERFTNTDFQPTFAVTNLTNDQTVTEDCTVLGTASFRFRSTGTFRQSSRALEIGQ
jgi:hypothetical protein